MLHALTFFFTPGNRSVSRSADLGNLEDDLEVSDSDGEEAKKQNSINSAEKANNAAQSPANDNSSESASESNSSGESSSEESAVNMKLEPKIRK
jgi:hypothetical protein